MRFTLDPRPLVRACLGAVLAIVPVFGADAVERSPAAEVAIRALRESRAERTRPEEDTIAAVAAAGVEALEPLLDVLVERRLPALDDEDEAQILSEPQQRMLLAALARWPARSTLDSVDRRIVADAAPATRRAALFVYSELGGADDLERTVGLALSEAESALSSDLDKALRAAVRGILLRDAPAFTRLRDLLRTSRAELRAPLLFAAAATGDARAQPAFIHALAYEPDVADVALAQIRLLARSHDVEQNRALAAEARRFLGDDNVNRRAAAVRACGELRDPASVPALGEMLDSESRALADAALWALRRISGMSLPPTRAAWTGWYEAELATWEHLRLRIEQLENRDPAERLATMTALANVQLFREEAAAALAPALRDDDERLRVRCCNAMATLGAPAAYPALLEALEYDTELVRAAALGALESIAGRTLPAETASCRSALGL